MLCKENVVSWFGSLSSYKRIDLMCTLLNMCLPFEVRYLGTCVEDLGKRDYNDLRDTEHHANNETDLAEVTNVSVTDKRTRRKLALYMALLHSCNYSCAVTLFKNLSNFDSQEISNLLSGTTTSQDEQILEELLLLYIMALNHPAFTYEQKSSFGDIYMKLQEEEVRLNVSKPGAKPGQVCMQSCENQNDRMVDSEITSNCLIPPPPMQTYHGDISMRNNNMVTGIPPGMSLPPPGICLPSPEQMSLNSGVPPQYFHMGFPSMNHMQPYTGQVMMGNQFMYHTGDTMAYPQSPLVSRQSSPSQSRSPSRSNSPLGRRNSTLPRTSSQTTQPTSSAVMTSTTSSSSQTSIVSSSISSLPPPLPSVGANNRTLPSQAPILIPRSIPPPITSTAASYSRQNNVDITTVATASTMAAQQLPPPPRLRPSASTDLLRDVIGKEVPGYKGGNLLDEIRRMSDEDLRDIGMPQNAVGQLRNIVKGQTSNGLNQMSSDKKVESPNNVTNSNLETLDNELGMLQIGQGVDASNDNGNTSNKSMPLMEPQAIHNSHAMTNMRRYPTMPPMEHMTMYPAPPPMYAPQTAPCYTCLTFPVATSMQSRFSRCSPQYCLSNMSSLKLDPDNSRHYSQSSSSESSGSRSPPDTPPAAPWLGGGSGDTGLPPVTDYLNPAPIHSVAASLLPAQPVQQQAPLPERQRRKNQGHGMRHKNNQMMNGGGLPSLPHCVPFPAPPSHSQLYLSHGHFPALRPSTGMYTNFSHAAYARPTYQPTYQPNGEMMYPYTAHPGSGGTPPPPNTPAPAQTYMPPAAPPVVTFTSTAPPTKISCYNCGSSSHVAGDCKDQTMEDLTKRAQYRLDYTIPKQPGECSSCDK